MLDCLCQQSLQKKYDVTGFDIHKERVDNLNIFKDLNHEFSDSELEIALKNNNFIFTSEISQLSNCNIFIITVPTPIDENKKPDLHHLLSASQMIGKLLKKDDIVI